MKQIKNQVDEEQNPSGERVESPLNAQGRLSLTREHIDIMRHTRDRAAGGFYCGDSPSMQELVVEGLMVSAGRKSFVVDEYFQLTPKGRDAIRT